VTGKAKNVMTAAGALAVVAAILNGAAVLSNAGPHPGTAPTASAPSATHAAPNGSAGGSAGSPPGGSPGGSGAPPGTTRTVKTYCQSVLPIGARALCLHITRVRVLVDAVTAETDLPGAASSADADTAKIIAGAVAGWAAGNVHTTAGTGGTATVTNTAGADLATAHFGD
jgi:hypothetical protein